MTTRSYWGTSRLAAELGVPANTLSKWIARYADTPSAFPRPDVTIDNAGGGVTRGWAPGRRPEIERWLSARRLAPDSQR